MIITFSGLDGAGKSTQIGKLTRFLHQRGNIVYYVWSRGGYTPGMELVKAVFRGILGRSLPSSGHSQTRTESLSSPWVSYLWLTAAMLDLIFLYGVVVRLRSQLGQVVICDRYLGDTALDFSLNLSQVEFEKMRLWRLLIWVTPKPDNSFLLLMPVSISIERSKLKQEPFPDSKERLEKRLTVYQDGALFDEYERIDALQGIEVIEEQIKKKLGLLDAS